MRILHVITSLRTGGAERLVSELLPRFREAGIDVELAIFDATPSAFLSKLESEGIKIHKFGIGYKSMYNPLHILKLRHLIGNFDIIHTHNSSCQLFTAIATKLITHKPILVTTEHNTSNRRRKWKWYNFIDKWMYEVYNAIICCSSATAYELKNSLNSLSTKIHTIQNGIDIDEFKNSSPEYNLSQPSITMVAAFRPQKDHHNVIDSLKYIPNAHLYLAGNGETRNEIETYVSQNKLEAQVHFLGHIDDIGNLYKSSDCAILCSKYEGFGLSAVEAMASGTPIIVSDVPGLRDVVSSAGILVPPSDAEALANAIRNVLTDSTLRASLVKAGLERASQFSIESTVNQYIALYNNLIFK